ncbi:uncharacterized protein LOC130981442 [Arachis stenosperma]|uniref:uncharacterized protein LOC130981442 n=1 Tax=Arachis stenosperma TaxID=217475 RepID=UPI0025AD2B54|nr:uncharacterized protein LOC130981442 [Arachis stenosperma]
MSLPRHSQEFRDGVNRFLDYAYSVGNPQGEKILCPCAKCCNFLWGQRESIHSDLICFGFVKGYTRWVNHGESVIGMDVDTGDTDEIYSCDDIEGLLDERFRNVADVEGEKEGMNEDAKKFYNLVDESNASFTSLLKLLKEAIPNLNLPSSFNKAKAMVRDLGLDYKKIDACPNDSMLYWKEHENETCCHECGTSRWIEPAVVEGDISSKKAHNIPAKTLRHFPLIDRLQRLFMCSKTAKNMSWHQEERKKDGKLKHPADGQSWKDFDNRHSEFAKEPRNLRLGLASDGFNPFRTMSISHST